MMTFLICLVAVALIISTKVFKDKPEARVPVAGGLGILLMLLVLLRFTACSGERPPPRQLSVDRNWAVGWRLGVAVADQVADGGKVLVLQNQASEGPLAQVAASQVDGLRHSLPEETYELVVLKPDALQAFLPEEVTEDGAEKSSLKDSLMAGKDAQAIVSFVYLPVTPRMKDALPPVYLLDSHGTGFWVASMKAGVVQAAVTTHRDSSKINFSMEDGPPQERFDAIYQLFTPENMETFK